MNQLKRSNHAQCIRLVLDWTLQKVIIAWIKSRESFKPLFLANRKECMLKFAIYELLYVTEELTT